ncbi:MAG: NUDIX domain-containing protein [bacterium]|nr:NUDIX domain-containing protein [bacterium]
MPSTERNKAIPACYLILEKDGNILMMLRQNTGYYDGHYVLPSGHLEAGELPVDCLMREAKEEIGIDIDRASVRLAHTMYRTKIDETGDRADYFFTAYSSGEEPINCEPDKCVEIKWFPKNALPENIMHHVGIALERIAHGETYTELTKEELKDNPAP